MRDPVTGRIGPQPVRDPVSIGITAISLFEAVTGAAVGFEAASFVGSVIITGSLIGANLLLSSRGRGDGSASAIGNVPLNAQEIRINRRQPLPHERIVYGYALMGGDLALEQVDPPYLVHHWLLSARKVSGFVQMRIGTDIIAISTTTGKLPTASIITPQGKYDDDGTIIATPDYASNLRASLRVGTSSQTLDPLLASRFASLDSSFRQRGIATACCSYKWPGSNYDDRQAMWGDVQAPNPLFLIEGSLIYDPRDPTQGRDDQSTWKFSNNAALVQADYLRADYGGNRDPDDIRWDKVIDAANYDDELVGTLSGEFIKRHTINGVITLNQSPAEVIPGLLTANRGFMCESGGYVWISSARVREPVLTINDGMLVGGIEFQSLKPKRDNVNNLLSRFVSLDRNYQEVDGPPYRRADLEAEDGETLTQTLTLPFTDDYRAVERLQKQFLLTARLGKRLSVRIALWAWAEADDELVGETVRFESDLFSPANGLYRVNSVGLAEDMSYVELSLSIYDPSIETAWTPSTDEVPFTIAALDLS